MYAATEANRTERNRTDAYAFHIRLTDQLCKDMVIVFVRRIQSKYLLTKQKILNTFRNEIQLRANTTCMHESECRRKRKRKRDRERAPAYCVYKVFNHIYSHIRKHFPMKLKSISLCVCVCFLPFWMCMKELCGIQFR